MNNFKKKYQEEVIPKLKEEFAITNSQAAPAIEKVVVNAGMAEALQNREVLEKMKDQLASITGQMPKVTIAKKSIASFKLKAKDPIGLMVTLRGHKKWDFLEKFITLVAPRIRDFRGMDDSKFDNNGNYNVGMAEQTLFPQLDYSKVDKARGLVVTLIIKKSDKEKSKRTLELLGLPFKKSD